MSGSRWEKGAAGMAELRKALLVAATGGHLEQISRLESAFRPRFDEVEYATFDDPQSRSLLAGRTVHHVGYIPPRGVKQAVLAQVPALNILRSGGYSDVISTGSAIAVPFLAAARMLGIRSHYVESAARSEGPSLSGRMVSRAPRLFLYTQYPTWAEGKWQYRGSVFDRYVLAANPKTFSAARRVVVTLGTMRTYSFRRAVDAVRRHLPAVTAPDVEVLWQVGETPVGDLPIDGKRLVPAEELKVAIREADLVIAHAGIGSCLQILDAGRAPVLLPRREAHGEHVDDHQRMIAFELDRRGLAISRDPDELSPQDLRDAMERTVEMGRFPVPFRLQGQGRDSWDRLDPDEAAALAFHAQQGDSRGEVDARAEQAERLERPVEPAPTEPQRNASS